MLKFGVENVRGGSYSQVELSAAQRENLERELRGETNSCFKCGQSGHFANKCKVSGSFERFRTVSKKKSGGEERCFRCGRRGHFKAECYAKTDSRGRPI